MDAADRFTACGEHLGLAFQLADDLKDLASSNSGKTRFSDVFNRNPSFPVLHAVQSSDALRHEMRELWAADTITREQSHALGLKVLDTGAASVTRDAIVEHVSKAFDALGPYREREGGAAVMKWANDLAQIDLAETDVA